VRAETRRQLKQDAFSRVTIDAAERTAHWSVEHRTNLIIGAVVVAVLLAAGIGGWYYLSAQDEKASLELSQAVRTRDIPLRPAGTPEQPDQPSFTSAKDRTEAAKKLFQAIVDKYPHTRSSDMAHYFLGACALELGDNASAEKNFKEVASVGNKDVSSVAKMALASLYAQTNRSKEAIPLYQSTLADREEVLGQTHPDTLKSRHNLACAYRASGRLEEANTLHQRTLADAEQVLGPDHPDTLTFRNDFAAS